MEDYKKLVNRLREEPKDSRKAVLSIYDLCVDAACAIESLLDKLKHAEAERDIVTRHMIELEQDVCRLKSRLAAYEDTGLEPEEIKDSIGWMSPVCVQCDGKTSDGIRTEKCGYPDNITKCLEQSKHLAELAQAKQDGRLVVLPCKAGDHVWVDGREAVVENFFGYETERYLHAQFYDNMQYIDIPFTEIGKTVFINREEADAALKGGDSPENRTD